MEDVKWLLKKCGLPILILLFAVDFYSWGNLLRKMHEEEQKVARRSMGASCRNRK